MVHYGSSANTGPPQTSVEHIPGTAAAPFIVPVQENDPIYVANRETDYQRSQLMHNTKSHRQTHRHDSAGHTPRSAALQTSYPPVQGVSPSYPHPGTFSCHYAPTGSTSPFPGPPPLHLSPTSNSIRYIQQGGPMHETQTHQQQQVYASPGGVPHVGYTGFPSPAMATSAHSAVTHYGSPRVPGGSVSTSRASSQRLGQSPRNASTLDSASINSNG
ncbi:hypothetical protein PENSPDRAFT_737595, partial [Peniophora sp. CONT]